MYTNYESVLCCFRAVIDFEEMAASWSQQATYDSVGRVQAACQSMTTSWTELKLSYLSVCRVVLEISD